MFAGFNSEHSELFSYDSLTREQFMVLAAETATRLGWMITIANTTQLVTNTLYGAYPWKGIVAMQLADDHAIITATSSGTETATGEEPMHPVLHFKALLKELQNLFPPDALTARYGQLYPLLTQPEPVTSYPARAAPKERPKHLGSLFIPARSYFFTPVLLNINLLLFIIMCLSGTGMIDPTSEDLIKWGANYKPLTLNGAYWRLISCCFLHAGIVHLVMNMITLVFIGALLEPRLGKIKFITAYLLTGMVASAASLLWHANAVSVGASGAIFGLFGVFLALLTTKLIEKRERKKLLIAVFYFVIYSLASGFRTDTENAGQVDNAAHIGGLISGLLIGYLFYPSLKRAGVPDPGRA